MNSIMINKIPNVTSCVLFYLFIFLAYADADIEKNYADPSEKNHGECANLLNEKEKRNDIPNIPSNYISYL